MSGPRQQERRSIGESLAWTVIVFVPLLGLAVIIVRGVLFVPSGGRFGRWGLPEPVLLGVAAVIALVFAYVPSRMVFVTLRRWPVKHIVVSPVTRVGLHWIWRAAIAIVVGCGYAALSVTVLGAPHEMVTESIRRLLGGPAGPRSLELGVGVSVGYFLPALLIAFVVYGLLTRRLGSRPLMDGETRCRECGYILRGISEPRCPECGERI